MNTHNKKIDIYDIETFNEAFILCTLDRDTLEKKQFEISNRKNDIQLLLKYFNTINGQIGYNNLNFDYPVLHWIINNWDKYNTPIELTNKICQKAQDIINEEFSEIYYKNIIIPQLDLFKIWHFNGKAKTTSLKYLEFVMRMDNIQDLPYDIYDSLSPYMIDNLIEYCHHDVKATYQHYLLTLGITEDKRFIKLYKGKDKIHFRNEMSKKFKTDFLNFNDVKIGEEINKLSYLKATNKKWNNIRHLRTVRHLIPVKKLIPDYIKYTNKPLQDLLDFITDKSINCHNPKLEYKFNFANKQWKFALGGIHTNDSGKMTVPKPNQNFEERDVGSMYPNKIIEAIHPDFKTKGLYPAHLGIEWLTGYSNNKDERLKRKSILNKTPIDIQLIETLKLALNGGGYGKTGEETNWQYDPLVKYTTTIACQLDILMLADMLWNTNIVEIESGNTDSLNILYDKKYTDLINDICKKWEKITSASLETTGYKKLIRTSVNDYIAITSDGKIKLKGDFEIDKELHKNHSQRIVPLAIYKYYFENISIENTIKNHIDIFDFCKAVKGNKNIKFVDRRWDKKENKYIDKKLQKKVNRYIVSNTGTKLIKILNPLLDKDGKDKRDKLNKYRKEHPQQTELFNNINDDILIAKDRNSEIEAGYKTTVLNNIKSKNIKNYDINYNYYIDECYKIIKQLIN